MRFIILAAIATALLGCQGARLGGGVEGTWTTADGVGVSTFTKGGSFTTRVVSTGETVVEDGRYSRTGDTLTLAWTSLTANERRSAECMVLSSTRMTCTPSVGPAFTLTRSA